MGCLKESIWGSHTMSQTCPQSWKGHGQQVCALYFEPTQSGVNRRLHRQLTQRSSSGPAGVDNIIVTAGNLVDAEAALALAQTDGTFTCHCWNTAQVAQYTVVSPSNFAMQHCKLQCTCKPPSTCASVEAIRSTAAQLVA